MGFELSFPVGFRRAHAAVRHVQLQLAREHAILCEQERQIAHDLSAAISEKNRAYEVAQTNLNRRSAASDELEALEAVLSADAVDQNQIPRLLDQLLDAQRRLAEAESRHFRSLVEYMLAIRRVHYSKGSLLDYNEVYLSEGAWPKKAYSDALQRDKLRLRSWSLTNFVKLGAPVVGTGVYPQQIGPPGVIHATGPVPSNGETIPVGPSIETPVPNGAAPRGNGAEPLPMPPPPVGQFQPPPRPFGLAPVVSPSSTVVSPSSTKLAPIVAGSEFRKNRSAQAKRPLPTPSVGGNAQQR